MTCRSMPCQFKGKPYILTTYNMNKGHEKVLTQTFEIQCEFACSSKLTKNKSRLYYPISLCHGYYKCRVHGTQILNAAVNVIPSNPL